MQGQNDVINSLNQNLLLRLHIAENRLIETDKAPNQSAPLLQINKKQITYATLRIQRVHGKSVRKSGLKTQINSCHDQANAACLLTTRGSALA